MYQPKENKNVIPLTLHNNIIKVQWFWDVYSKWHAIPHIEPRQCFIQFMLNCMKCFSQPVMKFSGSVDVLRPVKSLDCLLHLRLHNSVRGVSNPLCMRQNYKQELCNYMAKLDTLDGEVLKGPSMYKYYVGVAIYDRNLVDKLWKGSLHKQWVKTVCDWVRFYQSRFLWF